MMKTLNYGTAGDRVKKRHHTLMDGPLNYIRTEERTGVPKRAARLGWWSDRVVSARFNQELKSGKLPM